MSRQPPPDSTAGLRLPVVCASGTYLDLKLTLRPQPNIDGLPAIRWQDIVFGDEFDHSVVLSTDGGAET